MEGSYGVEESRRLLASKDLLDGTNSLSRNMWTNVSTKDSIIVANKVFFLMVSFFVCALSLSHE